MSRFRINANNILVTFAQCATDPTEVERNLQASSYFTGSQIKKYIIARELHQDGNPHLHLYLRFEPKLDSLNNRVLDFLATDSNAQDGSREYHANIQSARNVKKTIHYCVKDGNYLFWPVSFADEIAIAKQTTIKKNTLIGKRLMTAERVTDLLEEFPELMMNLKRTVENHALYNLLKAKPYTHTDVRGVWIWGDPGTGKSHAVRTACDQDIFLKAQNKWWCGYQNQRNVLLDDFDQSGKCLGHYLKIWADKWSCDGEIKGATIHLTHHRFFITSNYHPSMIWKQEEDPALLSAIERRFQIILMTQRKTCNCMDFQVHSICMN